MKHSPAPVYVCSLVVADTHLQSPRLKIKMNGKKYKDKAHWAGRRAEMIDLFVTSLTQFPRVAQRVKIHAGRVPCRGTAAGRGDQRELWGRVPVPEPQALHKSQPGSLWPQHKRRKPAAALREPHQLTASPQALAEGPRATWDQMRRAGCFAFYIILKGRRMF